MIIIKTACPECRCALKVGIDDSEGPPSEAGAECDHCGAIPVFVVETHISYSLGEVLYDERRESLHRRGHALGEDVIRQIAEKAEARAFAESFEQAEAIDREMESYGTDSKEYKIFEQLLTLRQWSVWVNVEQAIALCKES